MAFYCIIKVIGVANLRNLLDMKIIEIVKINRELLRNLHIAGVRLDDTNYIDLYTEYRRMLENREKSILHSGSTCREIRYK